MKTSSFATLVACLLLSATSLTWGQALSVSMPFPAFRSSFITGTDVNIQATTTTPTNTTVTKVEFFLGTFTGPGGGKVVTKLGEDNTAPFSYTWTIPVNQISYNELSLVVTNSTGATAVQGGTGYNRVDVYPANYSAAAVKYYVKAGASANNNGLSASTPFPSIQTAADRVAPGDSVFVMAGTYTNTGTNDVVTLRRTGTPARWIVFTNYQSDVPKLSFNGWQGFQLNPCSAYLKIQGFEIIGNNANVTLPQATTQPGSCDNPTGTVLPIFNGNGISLSGRTGGNVRPHHVVLSNNIIHDCGGAGMSAIESDYVTIENNTVYNNAWYTIYGASGISILNAWNYDANTSTPRTIIRGNRSYGNRLFVKWRNGTVCQGITDGNGIILDNNNATFGANPIGAYTGKFLIENNLCYQNGGRGINVNYSDNATVVNNTFYQNAASPEISTEFAMRYAVSTRFYNNIFSLRSDKPFGAPVNSPDLLFNNNLTFGGTGSPYFTGNQNITGLDPRFADAPNANFQLTAASPAVNAGSNVSGQFSAKDILGIDRPQGAGVDMGAFELRGTPLTITQQPASSSAVCPGTSVNVSVSVDGPVKTYQWYKDGRVLTGVSSATTASLSLANVTTADAGSYSVVITGFNSLTSNAFNLTVIALQTPTVQTQQGQAYPGGQSLVSVDVNSGDVNLVVSGCNGGTVNWTGPNNSSGSTNLIQASTARVGRFVYQATCTTNGCTGPPASATVVVTGRLTVLHRDVDNYADNNAVQPLLQLQNQGSTSLPLSKLTLRYYLTVEGSAPLSNFFVNYAQVGNQYVKLSYVPLNPVQQGASGYVEMGFTDGAGSLAAGANSGAIQSYFAKSDYSSLNELDDYSYAPVRDQLTSTLRITAYYDGVLITGIEPGAGNNPTPGGLRAIRALTESKNGPSATQINTYLEVRNEGTTAINYSELKARYYFTADGDEPLQVEVDEGNVSAQLVKLPSPVAGADYYLELLYNQTGQLAPGASTGTIRYRISKPNGGRFDQTNDYSYQEQPQDRSQNSHVVVLVNNQVGWGTPPTGINARVGVSVEPGNELSVRSLGNPIVGGVLEAEVTGAVGHPLTIQLTDLQGRVITRQVISTASATERVKLLVGEPVTGLLLLRVSTPGQQKTLKVIKAD